LQGDWSSDVCSSDLIIRIGRGECLHAGASGTATVRVFDLAALGTRPDCIAIVKALAAADSDYAAGEEISSGHSASPARSDARAEIGRASRRERAQTP